MTKIEIEDIAGVLEGFEHWKAAKIQQALNPSSYSVSMYLDELAKQRAFDTLMEIRSVYEDDELTWQEIDKQIRAILGV